uniref:hypothetical protein n=1 Tax=Photobacterium leiognathi TaxID=553611 RepID=UPI00387FA399
MSYAVENRKPWAKYGGLLKATGIAEKKVSTVFLSYLHGREQSTFTNHYHIPFLSYLHGREQSLKTWGYSFLFLSYLHGRERAVTQVFLKLSFLSYLHGRELHRHY